MRNLIFLLSLIFFAANVKPLQAITQFTTDYQISYQVNADGLTHVKYDIYQTNNLSRVYATDFSLSISYTNLKNIKVKDIDSDIEPDIFLAENITNINFTFKNKVVGKGKSHHFVIEYDTPDIASKSGNVWEINIPKIQTTEAINHLEINLITPKNFPQLAYIDPQPIRQSAGQYTFSSQSLANKSISALFGNQQFFNLKANYFLSNPSNNKISKSIALPPDTSYQKVFIKQIKPRPTNISVDPDGNWLASYKLEPQQNLKIFLEETIKLSFSPQPNPNTADLKRYLEPTAIWDFNQANFQKISQNLKSPKEIFDFTISSLIYNYSLINKDPLNRQTASSILDHPTQAICTDFSNLFISLARKRGIPAREIQGFAFSQNDKLKPLSLAKDVLHAWPEYYDKDSNTWIQVDPTWTNTTSGIDYFNKLDLNHIAFVIHGSDPIYPLPAGFYKQKEDSGKDVEIKVDSQFQFPPAKLAVELKEQKGSNLLIKISNLNGVGIKSKLVSQLSGGAKQSNAIRIAPLSQQEISLNLPTRSWFSRNNKHLIISINQQHFDLQVKIKPLLQTKHLLIFLVGLIVLIVLIIKKINKTNSVSPVSIKI